MEVHPFAARGFAEVADAYERARPGYPEAAVAWLAERLGLGSGDMVVDVGAGTGKLTRQLLGLGLRVIAVEPIAGMREVLARTCAAAEVLGGAAERLPVADGAADAVTAGQAAHWFRPDEAAAEFARVLRPRGGVGLIWNVRDRDDPVQAEIDRLVDAGRREAARAGWERWREGLERGPFTPLEHAEFRHRHELAAEDVPTLLSSFSYVGGLPAAERESLLEQARELVAAHGEGRRVRLAYRADAYACRKR